MDYVKPQGVVESMLAGGTSKLDLPPRHLVVRGMLAGAYLGIATSMAVTAAVDLGTSVLVVPYRHPLTTAKMLATIDRLSKGRVILGVGTGWLREEFEAVGAPPFEERGRVTDEYIARMRRAWTTDPVTFDGTYARVKAVHVLPKPARPPGIPIWVGGHTDAAVRAQASPAKLAPTMIRSYRRTGAPSQGRAIQTAFARIAGSGLTSALRGSSRSTPSPCRRA